MVRFLLSLMLIFMDPCQFLYVLQSSPLHSERTVLFSFPFPQIYFQKLALKGTGFLEPGNGAMASAGPELHGHHKGLYNQKF